MLSNTIDFDSGYRGRPDRLVEAVLGEEGALLLALEPANDAPNGLLLGALQQREEELAGFELGSQLIGGREGALGWLPSWKAQDGGQARSTTNTFLGLPQPAPGPTSPNLPVSEAHGSLGQALGHQRASPVSARLSRGFEVSSQLIGLTSPAGSAAGGRSITNTPHQQARPARAAWSRAR